MKEQLRFMPPLSRSYSPSKAERLEVSPPPNPSFKRTCLRQAA
jgi:hypothetical protein